ncbi:voltage-gated potassium channel [Roseovarius gaetbuli]|uniref:Voltage-gated potassium channel n=1 Tax=Roseovarius gaetbuli TaxID=1356575 RepID=A0A1X6Y8G9_9RHOB|nr:potassium channel family protein [Roseovarius gaetbuli]SLN13720.1 voltage-gated potassium channel [Roseovarius gaetbuli]
MQRAKALTLVAMLVLIIAGGTAFFHAVEGWSWLDSYFFTVVTLSTVGYGNLVPATALGKIGTTVFIMIGLGIFAVIIQQFGSFAVKKREEHTEWLIARLGHHHKAAPESEQAEEAPPSANRDRPPQ